MFRINEMLKRGAGLRWRSVRREGWGGRFIRLRPLRETDAHTRTHTCEWICRLLPSPPAHPLTHNPFPGWNLGLRDRKVTRAQWQACVDQKTWRHRRARVPLLPRPGKEPACRVFRPGKPTGGADSGLRAVKSRGRGRGRN